MAIALDSNSRGNNSANHTVLSWTHTCTGSNLALYVLTSVESDTAPHTAQTVSGVVYGKISAVNLTQFQSSTDATSYATTSITPAANKLIIATVTSSKGTTPNTPTLSGNGLTWVQILTNNFDTVGTQRTITMFRAMGSSPTSGAVTADFGGATQTACTIIVDEFTGADTSGTNGSGAIVQSAQNAEASQAAATFTVTLGAFGSTNNATYGVASNGDTANFTAGTGFASVGGVSSTTPIINTLSEFRNDNDTTVDFGGAIGYTSGGIAIEIKPANSPQSLTNITSKYITGNTDNGVEIWRLINPSTGANTVSVTYTGEVDGSFGAAVSFTGVDQTTPEDATAGVGETTPAGASVSASITTSSDNSYLLNVVHAIDSTVTLTKDASDTQLYNEVTTGDHFNAVAYRNAGTAGSKTSTWSVSPNNQLAMAMVSIRPVAAAVTIKTLAAMGVG